MIILIALLALLVIALLIVIKSADIFVDHLVEIGEALGVSQIILGVTASAIGTSLAEFGSAMIAILTGSTDIGVGVVIGSNIWNIAGILGISAFVAGFIQTNRQEITRDGLMTLLTAIILLVFISFMYELTAIVGIVLIAIYIGYLWILIRSEKKKIKENNNKKHRKPPISKKNIIMVVLGLIGLIIGARLLVYSGVEIANILNIPQMLIGLFALAIGTSMPELVVTLTSAMRKLHSFSFGTVLGSNVFNIMIGLGVPALFMNIPIEPLSVTFDAPVMVLVTALLLILAGRKMKLTRYAGLLLMIIYVIYIVIRIFISV